MHYTIKFKYPEATMYAGLANGALGWAPTLTTALFFKTAEEAQETLANGYGEAQAEYASIVQVDWMLA